MLENLSKTNVFKHFEELTKIPHGSGNEKEISDYLKNFGESLGLETFQDNEMNIIIKKPATKGYENAPRVILQGHMDMVCEKNSNIEHDFLKDALPIYIDGNLIKTKGTTLGADNGIAVAYMMNILESSDIKHPSLTIIITSNEENGMSGAIALSDEFLDSEILINIDSEEEGEVLLSCAGGARNQIHIPYNSEKNYSNKCFEISIQGLKGGHSGMDINKNRENGNKLLGRLLYNISKEVEFNIVNIAGGSKMNAIPREANVIISSKDNEKFEKVFNQEWERIENEIIALEKNIVVSCKLSESNYEECMTIESSKNIIHTLYLIPNGVRSMSAIMEGLVESSTNLGIMSIDKENKKVVFESALRSSVQTKKEKMQNEFDILANLFNGESIFTSSYPAWPLIEESKIKDLFVDTYKRMFNKVLKTNAIHAGLECGIFADKRKDLDMISFGPNMHDVHSPDERLEIDSTNRMYDYLCEILENIK